MARNDVHVYKLSKEGRLKGIHCLTVNGEMVKIDKYGVARIPDPGIQNPEAHHLRYMGTEGEGRGPVVDPELVKAHQEVKDAEDMLAEAKKDLDAAEADKKKLDPKKDEEKIKAADEEIATLKKSVDECKATLDKAKKDADSVA